MVMFSWNGVAATLFLRGITSGEKALSFHPYNPLIRSSPFFINKFTHPNTELVYWLARYRNKANIFRLSRTNRRLHL